MRNRVLTSVAIAGVALCTTAPEAAAQRYSTQVYILAGQSNMVGYGSRDDLSPAEKTVNWDIKVYGNDWVQKNALDPLDDSTGQIDKVSLDPYPYYRVGPGLFFARKIYADTVRTIILIPCAKGGSSISEWAPVSPPVTDANRDTLYGSCIMRARKYYGNFPISGILWYQGESDTHNATEVAQWSGKFQNIITAFRRDLNRPNLPVVFVGLGNKPASADPTLWSQMQINQASFSWPCTKHVSARGLAQNPDGLHLSTAGQRALGPMLATAMVSVQQTPVTAGLTCGG